MRYKNISDSAITVEQTVVENQTLKTTSLKVEPGEEFVTSPGRAASLLESGKVEKVVPSSAVETKPAIAATPAQAKKKEPGS